MAINTSSLTAYVGDNKEKLISKAVIGAKSASKFNLVTGVKGAQKLNLLDTTVVLQDGSACGWTEAGTSKLSQRTIEAKPIKVNQEFCDKQLLATSLNYEVKVAAGQKTLPFEEDFVNGVIDGIAAEVQLLQVLILFNQVIPFLLLYLKPMHLFHPQHIKQVM